MRGLQLVEKGTRGNLTCRPARDKVAVTISVIHVWLKETHELYRETIGKAPRDQHLTNLRLQDRKSKFIWEESAWWEFSFMSPPAWKATSRKPFSWVHLPIHRRPCYFTRHRLNLKLETDPALLMCHWFYMQAKPEEQWDSWRLLPILQKAAAVRQYMAKTDASQESPEMLSHEGVYVNHKWYWRLQDVGPYHHKPTQESCKHNTELLQEMETLHATGSRDWGRLSTMSNTDAAATDARYRVARFRVCTNSVQSCDDPAFPFSAFILFLSNGTAHSIPLNTGNMQLGFSGDHGEETVLSFIGSLWAVLSFLRVFEQCWYGKLWHLLKLKYMYFASSDGHKPGARYGTSRSMCS